ncbi:hypothetical protein BD779DRAFT_85875 [Infundibulicybe gibba]|nr:hypothetical protein BD779DRAFT_85875 [Infundibulicybe gibba]
MSSLNEYPLRSLDPQTELPSELFIIILELCIEAGISPISLSHVSQRWRTTALCIPSLWKSLEIDPRSPPDMLVAHVERSQPLPVCIACDFATAEENDINIRQLWSIVMSCSERWSRLVIHYNRRTIKFIPTELRDISAPVMRTLEISTSSTDYNHTEDILRRGAPSLKQLSLGGLSINRCAFPFTALTQLRLTSKSSLPYNYFLEHMNGMHRLEELCIDGCLIKGWPREADSQVVVHLPSLRFLQLGDRFQPLFIPLQLFSAPQLHALVLHDVILPDLPEGPSGEAQIASNYPALQCLSLSGNRSSIDEELLLPMNRMFRGVTQFHLLEANDNQLNNLLWIMSSNPAIWPHAHTIAIAPMSSGCARALSHLIRSRMAAPCRLETVILDSLEGAADLPNHVSIAKWESHTLASLQTTCSALIYRFNQ